MMVEVRLMLLRMKIDRIVLVVIGVALIGRRCCPLLMQASHNFLRTLRFGEGKPEL